jgi:HEAT repeat protein
LIPVSGPAARLCQAGRERLGHVALRSTAGRFRGVAAPTQTGDQRAAPVLRKILLAPDATPYARTCAATALKKLGHDDGIAALIDLLKAEEMRSDSPWYSSTLMTLTGQQLPATYEAWHKWWVEEGSKPPAPEQP